MTYRGNSGGVAFGYNFPENISKHTIQVHNSVFRNNRAIAELTFRTTSQTSTKKIASGRGGSMAIYSNATHHNISITITNCVYENNFAHSYGGGLYVGLDEKIDTSSSQSEVLIGRTKFVSNVAGLGGGGLVIVYPETNITNCIISNNSAIAGGGIFLPSPLGRK